MSPNIAETEVGTALNNEVQNNIQQAAIEQHVGHVHADGACSVECSPYLAETQLDTHEAHTAHDAPGHSCADCQPEASHHHIDHGHDHVHSPDGSCCEIPSDKVAMHIDKHHDHHDHNHGKAHEKSAHVHRDGCCEVPHDKVTSHIDTDHISRSVEKLQQHTHAEQETVIHSSNSPIPQEAETPDKQREAELMQVQMREVEEVPQVKQKVEEIAVQPMTVVETLPAPVINQAFLEVIARQPVEEIRRAQPAVVAEASAAQAEPLSMTEELSELPSEPIINEMVIEESGAEMHERESSDMLEIQAESNIADTASEIIDELPVAIDEHGEIIDMTEQPIAQLPARADLVAREIAMNVILPAIQQENSPQDAHYKIEAIEAISEAVIKQLEIFIEPSPQQAALQEKLSQIQVLVEVADTVESRTQEAYELFVGVLKDLHFDAPEVALQTYIERYGETILYEMLTQLFELLHDAQHTEHLGVNGIWLPQADSTKTIGEKLLTLLHVQLQLSPSI